MKFIPLFILLFCSLMNPAGAAVKLKIATLLPDGTGLMKALRTAGKEIKTRTDGRVKMQFYPGGVMGNDKSVMRKIRAGQLHGAALSSSGVATLYSNAQIYSLPFTFRSTDEIDYARQQLDPQLIAGLKEKGFISYGLMDTGFAYIMSNTPIRLLDDLKGQRIWAPDTDKLSRTALETVGIYPILLPLTDVLTGLQTGLIDTVTIPPIGAIALQWHTQVKYVTDLPLLFSYGTLLIKERALKRINEGDRAIISEVMVKVAKTIDQQNRKDNIQATKALGKQGIEFVTLTDEQKQDWWSKVSGVTLDMHNNGSLKLSLYEQLLQLLDDYRQQQPTP
ncbi:MAG: TRAP transporter substrate-binding protein DctP [Candidatus Polarisedimenticolaceae bacterium]|nr:TRAP transporter substrate-binding protein DctP [Candidatus Polarisedimenticolaceae bacterium]